MDLLTRLKNYKHTKESTIPEIQYLNNYTLENVLHRGFAELYRVQPEHPVKFLSKWLYKEAKSFELIQKYNEEELQKEKLNLKFHQLAKTKHNVEQRQQQIKKDYADKQNLLLTEITDTRSHWKSFYSFCETLKRLTKATGCYLALFDFKRKPVHEDDDETAHIHQSNTKVIRYVAWCDDHEFLHGKCLEPNTGVTYTLFQVVPQNAEQIQQEQVNNENNQQQQGNVTGSKAGNADKKDEVVEEELPSLLIDDVVNDSRMQFFREPRLGCYFAVDITYQSSLSYVSLRSAIDAKKDYLEKKKEQDQRYEEWKKRKEEKEKELEELRKEEEAKKEAELQQQQQDEANKQDNNVQDNQQQQQQQQSTPEQVPPEQQQQQAPQDPTQNPENVIEEWTEEPVKLGEFTKEEKKIILCLDTLGQDRVFTENERKYILKVAKGIRDSIQNYEKKLLEKDRDIRITFEEEEQKIKEDETYDETKMEESATRAGEEHLLSESQKDLDETLKGIEMQIAKSKFYYDNILEHESPIFKLLLKFEEFEFVQYEKIFQSVFYFAQAEPSLINEPETNRIQWNIARTFWKYVFDYISKYNPRGPKPDRIRNIHKLNKIKENLEFAIAKREEVKEYSYSLLLLVDYVLMLIKIRHDDIVQRREKIMKYNEERDAIIQENNKIEEERNAIIEKAKALNPPVEGEAQGGVPQEQQQQIQQPVQPAEGNKEDGQNNQEGENQFNLEEELKKFDEEKPKKEVPPEIEFDLDMDYDVEMPQSQQYKPPN